MQTLIQFLQQSGQLTAPQIDLIRSRVMQRALKKGDNLSEPGRPATEFAFILHGIVRIFSYDDQGHETTSYFIDENNFAIDGNEYTQAVMQTELAILSPQALQSPCFSIADWVRLTDYIKGKALLDKAERIGPTLAGDATARYRKFMEKYPQIAGRVPLSYLASYLGITQQSLSRIRKRMTRKSAPRED
jgi:CRP-like cAMP-binding protein